MIIKVHVIIDTDACFSGCLICIWIYILIAVGGLIATTMNTVMNNYQTLHIMGMISGITNSAITAFLGGDDVQISEAFIKGYMTGFGIGAVMYVVAAYEIMTIAEMCMLMAASNTVMSVVLAFVAASSGNTKAVLVYGTLSVLSFYTFCKLYNANCTVDIVGNKGSVRVEFDNSDPYSPKLNGEKVNAGTPYETGADGENYVAEQLGTSGFKLRMYSWCLILSERTTVISCVMPARIKSACKVFSFWVRRPARQRLSLM